ncbi:MAG: branched-chain amino acid ABC transporter permease [Clostridia bacterium]|nr:branched-chain amino acid ABC transporter permease [Clostridia bacterium]
MSLISTLIDGLSLGIIYALIALGYTMVYGIAKMLNFAHGDIIMVGGYTIMTFFYSIGLPIVASLIAIIFCSVMGIIMEKLAYKPLRGASPLAVLITAIGVSYLLQSLALIIFGSDHKIIILNNWGMLKIGDFAVSYNTLLTLVSAVVIMIILTLFVNRTKVGKAMLAVSEDRQAASLMGISVNTIITITFAIGSALAAVAGVFYILKTSDVSTTMGSMPGIKAFTAAVIGGIGSIPGAMLGGLLLGVIETACMSVPALAPFAIAIEFTLLIVILLVKPTGLLGKKKREKV